MVKDRILSLLRRAAGSYVLIIVLGIVVGLLIAPAAWQLSATQPETVAVVPIEGGINGQTADRTAAMLDRARNDPSVAAVVLLANSGGGGASASESMYLEVLKTSKEMPVVASVDAVAASGAYYAIAPSEYIYAKPSSLVGSVGVFAVLPQDLEPIDIVATTGPHKLNGDDRRSWFYKIETLRKAFVGAVMKHRADDLSFGSARLSHARLYTGPVAVENGMVDEIGTIEDATDKAAAEAGLDEYTVKVMRPDGKTTFLYRGAYIASSAENKELIDPARFTGGTDQRFPTFYMLPPGLLGTESTQRAAAPAVTSADVPETAREVTINATG